LEAACRDLGIVFVPLFHSAQYLLDGRLVRVLPGWRDPALVPIHVVFPTTRLVAAKTRVFVDFMVQAFQRPPWSSWTEA
jgi:DNA-binding transcriptional LysR family regulator